MLAAPVDAIPEGPNLAYEPKWDGWRAIAFRDAAGVYLQSRAGRNLTPYFRTSPEPCVPQCRRASSLTAS
jgi:ATP-dependent DNA ligase